MTIEDKLEYCAAMLGLDGHRLWWHRLLRENGDGICTLYGSADGYRLLVQLNADCVYSTDRTDKDLWGMTAQHMLGLCCLLVARGRACLQSKEAR